MSQYLPPPYQPPQPGYAMPPGFPYNAGANAPARRAGILLFVLGGLAVLGGLCCGLSGSMIEQILAQQPEMAQQLPPEATPEVLRIGMLVVAGISFIYGVALVVLGLFVRKGSKVAIITAMVLAILTLLYLAGVLVRAVVVGAQQGVGEAGGGVCVSAVPLALYALLLVWLIQAVRGPAAARAGEYPPEYLAYLQQQYAQQQAYQAWQQHQQQGQVPPPPPPSSAD